MHDCCMFASPVGNTATLKGLRGALNAASAVGHAGHVYISCDHRRLKQCMTLITYWQHIICVPWKDCAQNIRIIACCGQLDCFVTQTCTCYLCCMGFVDNILL